MAGDDPYYILKIETKYPPELADFVSTLVGFSNQFDRFVRERHPDLSGSARFYVQEVRKGSLVVEILPFLQPIIERMDQILIIKEFAQTWGAALQVFLDGLSNPRASKSDLKDFLDTVKVVAKDGKARQSLSVAAFEDGKRQVRTVFKFETPEAKAAQEILEGNLDRLAAVTADPHRKVVMYYERMSKAVIGVGRGTGERVIVEELSDRAMPVVYLSDAAEHAIKALTSGHEFPWKLNFVVDVYVRMNGGKPSSYAVTNF